MDFEAMKMRVRSLREIAQWPQALELIDRPVHQESSSVWEFPGAACQAVGGPEVGKVAARSQPAYVVHIIQEVQAMANQHNACSIVGQVA